MSAVIAFYLSLPKFHISNKNNQQSKFKTKYILKIMMDKIFSLLILKSILDHFIFHRNEPHDFWSHTSKVDPDDSHGNQEPHI